ncbi:hypothetical protein OOZ15_05375 [Galbibacter sp. EGI 63066]|uniref:RHS repeat domain-containing protein n=1 Tax=Galbibacter sp. EGI 63066 TaxID=2993559 RepID=UPI00224880DE|nr:RHS repeat-associated core domain-containing protein [Galbibacter sp. EGI 63066]MCX2679367.1 hypothetical protein [Galbibacter sp. EGI 63066]
MKLRKEVTEGGSMTKTTDYAGKYIYEDDHTGEGPELEFFRHAEGYVTPKSSGGYDYVYQYKDYLGNIRLSYMDANNNGSVTTDEIIEESNYYPFGLQHKGYGPGISSLGNDVAKKFKYQGQELTKSLGYEMYEFELRHYDPATGRFVAIDPYKQFRSPYIAMGNNPVVAFDPDGGKCFDANGNEVVCPDDEMYDDYRDSDKNHITLLDEVEVASSDSSNEEEYVDINAPIGTQALPRKRTLLGKAYANLEPRSVTINGITYNVDAEGTVTGIKPLGGLGAMGLLGGLGSSGNLLKFKGLVQNLSLRSLTHHQLVKAFKGTGLSLSGHAITRLKDIRLQNLGVRTLNDFKQIINKGSKFDAGGGAIGFSHKRVEVIINPQTKVIVTIRPVKNIR